VANVLSGLAAQGPQIQYYPLDISKNHALTISH